jgi:glucans biosynthesis protein
MLRSWGGLPLSLCAGLLLAAGLSASPALAFGPLPAQTAKPVRIEDVFADAGRHAEALAAAPYQAPVADLPTPFQELDYDAYRKLRPRPEASIWGKAGNPFAILPLPRGGFYHETVAIHFIDRAGVATTQTSPAFIDFVDYPGATDRDRTQLGPSGWRAITKPGIAGAGYEFAVFQGGTYFRAVGEGQFYGVSARALAIGTGSAAGEEFPRFTDFWIFESGAQDGSLTFVALADSPSAAAAYRFTLRPGSDTTIDVVAEIHPRTDISEAGVAPLSSMYLHGATDPRDSDDTRPEVHDSDGLAIVTTSGERIWRPLANPRRVQMSAFASPAAGFGLEQRQREPSAYGDAEAKYERRPSIWIEPQGDWGAGEVRLLEIPTPNEYADNVAAFWRPASPWRAGSVQRLSYRLHWGRDVQPNGGVAKVAATHVGLAPESTRVQRIVIDYSADAAFAMKQLTPDVWSTSGKISNIQLSALPTSQRLSFDLDPGASQVVELHAALADSFSQQTETWLFRWTPE